MNEEIKQSYYAIIPATVRYDKKLKSAEKLLYGEITALSNKNGYCFAQNRYFAELYNVSAHTVSKWISNLEKSNYINIELIKTQKNEIKERRIYINDLPYGQKRTYPMDENVKDNNIILIDELFNLLLNNSEEIPKDFYFTLDRLGFIYPKELIEIMQEENIQKIKEIIYTIYTIYESNFNKLIPKFERETLVKLYLICKSHNTYDFFNYYKQAIINEYM